MASLDVVLMGALLSLMGPLAASLGPKTTTEPKILVDKPAASRIVSTTNVFFMFSFCY
jgi:hypothetical protein